MNRVYDRVREAEKLGFKRVFIPKNNLDGWELPKNIEVVGVSSVKEAIYKAFGFVFLYGVLLWNNLKNFEHTEESYCN